MAVGRLKRLDEEAKPPMLEGAVEVTPPPKSEPPDVVAGGKGVVEEAPKLKLVPVEGRNSEELPVEEAVEGAKRELGCCCN